MVDRHDTFVLRFRMVRVVSTTKVIVDVFSLNRRPVLSIIDRDKHLPFMFSLGAVACDSDLGWDPTGIVFKVFRETTGYPVG